MSRLPNHTVNNRTDRPEGTEGLRLQDVFICNISHIRPLDMVAGSKLPFPPQGVANDRVLIKRETRIVSTKRETRIAKCKTRNVLPQISITAELSGRQSSSFQFNSFFNPLCPKDQWAIAFTLRPSSSS